MDIDAIKQVYAVMVLLDGSWYPYRMYDDLKLKTMKAAGLYMRRHGLNRFSLPKAKVDKIWIRDESKERIKIYEKKDEVQIKS